MPQLDFTLYASQIFWFFVSFLPLLAFIKFFAISNIELINYKRIGSSESTLDKINVSEKKLQNLEREILNLEKSINDKCSMILHKSKIKISLIQKENTISLSEMLSRKFEQVNREILEYHAILDRESKSLSDVITTKIKSKNIIHYNTNAKIS